MIEYEMSKPPKDYSDSHTSKGNQLKWKEDGYWYKANQFGYEGLSEYVVTYFLKNVDVPFPFVKYSQAMIRYKKRLYHGCRSRDFYLENPYLQGCEIVPIERLHRQYTTRGLSKHLSQIKDVKSRVEYTVGFVRDITGLSDFADYLSFLIQIDAFFLNEDRHTNNIAVMWDPIEDKYEYCPYYDFGLSLFSDTREDFPLSMGFEECREIIKAKPFSVDFDQQLDECELLGTHELKFTFPSNKMRSEAENALIDYEGDERVKKRIIDTLVYQANKYLYMFQ